MGQRISNNIKYKSSSFWVRGYISSWHIKIYISNGKGIYSKKQVIFKLNIYLLFCWFCISLCFSLVLVYIYLFTYFYVFISNNYMQHVVNIECYTSVDIQKRRIFSINHNSLVSESYNIQLCLPFERRETYCVSLIFSSSASAVSSQRSLSRP